MDRQYQETTRIEILEKILGLLRVTEDYASDRNRTTKPASEEKIYLYGDTIPSISIIKAYFL